MIDRRRCAMCPRNVLPQLQVATEQQQVRQGPLARELVLAARFLAHRLLHPRIVVLLQARLPIPLLGERRQLRRQHVAQLQNSRSMCKLCNKIPHRRVQTSGTPRSCELHCVLSENAWREPRIASWCPFSRPGRQYAQKLLSGASQPTHDHTFSRRCRISRSGCRVWALTQPRQCACEESIGIGFKV